MRDIPVGEIKRFCEETLTSPVFAEIFKRMSVRYYDSFCKSQSLDERTKIAQKQDMLADFEGELRAMLNATFEEVNSEPKQS